MVSWYLVRNSCLDVRLLDVRYLDVRSRIAIILGTSFGFWSLILVSVPCLTVLTDREFLSKQKYRE